MDKKWIRFWLGIAALLIAAKTFAASVYRVERVDYREEPEALQLRVLIDDTGKRVDLLVGGKRRISFIEHGERLVLVDYFKGVYALGEPTRRTPTSPSSESWQVTARKQFVLGAYCNVYESRRSDAVYQERCAQTIENAEQRKTGTRIGTFLELVAANRDPTDVFLAAVRTLPEASSESQIPVVVRHVEQGRVVCEVRVLAVTSVASPGGAFDFPRGFKRVQFHVEGLKEARLSRDSPVLSP